ncbi:MAG: hypothetical protein LZF86_250050 [Nitrospira sp.]|nr:MAG: hypothetical protein LZF86_250050 [Nitrospira sp.]
MLKKSDHCKSERYESMAIISGIPTAPYPAGEGTKRRACENGLVFTERTDGESDAGASGRIRGTAHACAIADG